MKIGVFGHVGNRNLGDEAIISAVLLNVRRRIPHAELVAFTLRPNDTRIRHQIPAFPIRRLPEEGKASPGAGTGGRNGGDRSAFGKLKSLTKNWLKERPTAFRLLKKLLAPTNWPVEAAREVVFLVSCYWAIKGAELFIVAGSQQLIDYVPGKAWGHPYTVLKWTLLAKAAGAKVVFLAVGAGPLQTRLGRLFVKASLSLADHLSWRDADSWSLVQQLGLKEAGRVYPDLAYSLYDKIPSKEAGGGESGVVGINPVPFADPEYWIGGSHKCYKSYIETLAAFSRSLLEAGYSVMYFPTQLKLDPEVIGEIRKLLEQPGERPWKGRLLDVEVESFADLLAAIARCELIVAARFHGIVIPYLLAKPVLGIAYQPKTRQLMDQFEQGEFVIDINRLDSETMRERFTALEGSKAIIASTITDRLPGVRRSLDLLYDEVLGG
jgi:polysaccharide pyruvyl transferase WcaK-like protein